MYIEKAYRPCARPPLSGETAYLAAVKSLARDIHAIKGRMIDPGVNALIAGWNVLTPEQKAKARTMKQQHMTTKA